MVIPNDMPLYHRVPGGSYQCSCLLYAYMQFIRNTFVKCTYDSATCLTFYWSGLDDHISCVPPSNFYSMSFGEVFAFACISLDECN